MQSVTVSPKFQVGIPLAVREQLGIEPGQKLQVSAYEHRIEFLPLFQVFKRILQQRTEADALRAIALMRQGRVVERSDTLALGAARLSVDLKLPLADSIILHTARVHGATLWTQDAHFETVAGVAFARKGGPAA